MRLLSSMFALLAATAVSVTALQNPHERAAKLSKREFSPVYTRDTPKSNATTLFLNEKTKSRFYPHIHMSAHLNMLRICRKWDCIA